MKYTTPIEYDDLNDEYILPIPEELLDNLGWVEGDILKFEYTEEETIIIKKEND
jgi:bifunctional DNA-binding transcriptional regulator/antitoxin component of YhaV-PrlF toxin-antitoxin module